MAKELEEIKQSNKYFTLEKFSKQLSVINDFIIFSQEQFKTLHTSILSEHSFEKEVQLFLLLDAIELHLEALNSFESAAYSASITLERAAYERLLLIKFLEKNPNELEAYIDINKPKPPMDKMLTSIFGNKTPERAAENHEYGGLCDFSHPAFFGQMHRLAGYTKNVAMISLYSFNQSVAERALLHLMDMSLDLVKTETQMLQKRNVDSRILNQKRRRIMRKLRKALKIDFNRKDKNDN